jgi:hypothetical protein
MAVYNTNKEIFDAIEDNRRIKGIVEINFGDLLMKDFDIEYYNEELTSLLITEKYSYYLTDVGCKLVGCNIEKQTLLVEVNCNAEDLLYESNLTKRMNA